MQHPTTAQPPLGPADFVIVANRLPVALHRAADGSEQWRHSPGGLVSALEPFLRAHQGAWVGWPGVADARPDSFTDQGMRLHPVALSQDEIRDYYEGFANTTLWPLYHDAVVAPVFDEAWWDCYVRVNRRFAEAAAKVSAHGATVWVHDYQLQLVPAFLRALRPDLRIGFFLHIPFPPVELFEQLPWRRELVEGLLGADLVGFQLPGGALNFRRLAGRISGRIGQRAHAPRLVDREVRAAAFPISVDAAELDSLARTEQVREHAGRIRDQLGGRRLLLGVDRLDYTKGIDIRLRAFHELLAEGRLNAAEVALVQIATPSREEVAPYRRMRDRVEQAVGRINGEFGEVGRPAVHYLHTTVGREELAALYSAADVLLVTPLRDGMNLVAKEFVACRPDLGGALLLSEFAGAAAELTSAFLVNPHHLEEVKTALLAALSVSPEEGGRRMAAMRRTVLANDVDRWARSFLTALAGPAPQPELSRQAEEAELWPVPA
ncbi:alpha,alpha-trehalose-phosphate synthase (UDP-forming) [Kitasatospora sp. NBC_01266]|uniref:alpha,alpha-trehalose-phosphate synthase (UDP-forming) n=1 Tax=Kitasatospora sp. NBC_01266 TaxID=2903572 RepID=UPI002E2FC004|nr:trehalose-6-phosphate synthase [Kitasatospora sp. NBC_01266]